LKTSLTDDAEVVRVRPGRGPSQFESPGAIVTETGGATAQVSDHGSKAHALAALIIGSVSFGGLLIAIPLMLLLMDAKIQAGTAQAEATAQAGKEHARIALDEVQRANAQLEAKGLIRGSH
jgi:hypothetical protein